MIIPIGHESLRGRRWPYITIAIVVVTCLVFFGTHSKMENETKQLGEVQQHILLLAAVHPNAHTTPAEQVLIDTFRRGYQKTFDRMASPNRQPLDLWDLQMRDWDPDRVDAELASLGQQLEDLRQNSVIGRYAFYPSRRAAISYLTANFLHGGWLHLIFNMWFLWLAGTILEDVWGRPIYAVFYLVSGAAALGAYAAIYPNSLVPVIGASGAIASLMGAFLVRFPKTKIRLAFIYWLLFRPRLYRFSAPAYAVLPIWLVGQFFWGLLAGESGGVAYWAHIGGFAFGLVMALVLRATGIEHAVDKAIEAKVSWSADPQIVKASELLEKGQVDAAIIELQSLVQQQPEHVEAHEMLLNAYWRKHDIEAHKGTLETLCRLHCKAHNMEAAWQDYEELSNVGGSVLPSATWLELCRYLESRQNWERAAAEYEKLAQSCPSDRTSVLALIAAGRVNLKNLNNRAEAARLYRAAQASSVPHLDWEETIRRGLQEATGTGSVKPVSVPAGPLSRQ